MSQPKTREERISHELEILEKQIAWLVDWTWKTSGMIETSFEKSCVTLVNELIA